MVDSTLVLPPGSSLYGGFFENWLRDPTAQASAIQVKHPIGLLVSQAQTSTWISGVALQAVAPTDGGLNAIALKLVDSKAVVLDRVQVRGSDLSVKPEWIKSGKNDFVAGSSYGVLALNVDRLEVLDSAIAVSYTHLTLPTILLV